MSVTCYLSGRFGNIIFALANMFAYSKKYNIPYYVPEEAIAYRHFRNGNVSVPFQIKSTGVCPINPVIYNEPNHVHGTPCYHEIPKINNVKFIGYFQSFKYFDWCREYILDTFNFPYTRENGVVSISVRRGDCVGSTAFPIAPSEYYHKAVTYMQERGYNLFRVHSDDQEWCRKEFTSENYDGAVFEFTDGAEMDDFISISNCEHNITARSTFSLTAAWMNRNPDKIVLVPQEKIWWRSQNKDLIPDYFTQIHFTQMDNTDFGEYELEYDNSYFKLFIPDYWINIYKGKKREPLYPDYRVMLDKVKQVDKSKYILDIGANHGLFSVPASKLGYKVFGFEPIAKNVYSLNLAREANELKNFDMFHLALSNKNEEVDMYVPECPDNSSLSQVAAVSNMKRKDFTIEKVNAIRFDDWIKDHDNFKNVGLIKIDVQGAEYIIFEGMKDFLTNANDIHIICEFEPHLNAMGHTFKELNDLIYSYGFKFINQISNDRYFYKA